MIATDSSISSSPIQQARVPMQTISSTTTTVMATIGSRSNASVRSNRSAIGAKIRVKATISGKTFWQTRAIGVGGAGNPLEAHFDRGNATNVETLRIE